MSLYIHPNIRNLTADKLHLMIEANRQRRLITAIEANTARQRNLSKMIKRDAEKYTKIGDRLVTRLAKIEAALSQCDADLNNMQKLASSMGLVEAELGPEFSFDD